MAVNAVILSDKVLRQLLGNNNWNKQSDPVLLMSALEGVAKSKIEYCCLSMDYWFTNKHSI